MTLEVENVVRPAVGEKPFELGPYSLVGVELRGVCGEVLNVKPLALLLKFSYELPSMGDAVVPDHDEGSGYLQKELPEEACDIRPRGCSHARGDSRGRDAS